MQIPQLTAYKTPAKLTTISIILILIGVISYFMAFQLDPQRAWVNLLTDYYYWLCISLAGVFFAALQHITGSYWSVTVRRVAESFTSFLPIALIIFAVLCFGLHELYEWTHLDVVEADKVLKEKQPYLNIPFFIIRSAILFAICFLLGGKIIKNSKQQDLSGGLDYTKQNVKLSAIFLILFSWAFTFVSFDLIMSLSPHWFSTIFGIYCWAGLFTSGLAMLVLWVVHLKKQGALQGFVNENHLHDLGALMFAFMVFWAYVAFSQFMLIWYANLPEETFFYIDRLQGGWKDVGILLILAKFALPFLLIIARFQKRNTKWLVFMSIWFLIAQYIDLYWLIFPTFYKEAPVFGWMEVGTFLGFAGLFLMVVSRRLSRSNPVAIKDPRLEECLNHHR